MEQCYTVLFFQGFCSQ